MRRPPPTLIAQQSVHTGRGAISNRGSRLQPTRIDWDDGLEVDGPVTECRPVEARSIISRNTSPDIPFYQSINPYQGCEHGCVYCYARPTHAYLDLSPGLDFETRLTRKVNAAQQLARELVKPGYQCRGITLGANTDPYQPVEKTYRLTRQVLEVLHRARHPVSIITKSSLVTRDMDILADMATDGLASVAISVTTLDAGLKRRLEPRAPSGRSRLTAMAELASRGIPVHLLFAPVIPAINDCELEDIVGTAADHGAAAASYILLRLPLEVRELFHEWLEAHYPLRASHVKSLLRQCRGGRDNDPRFGKRMRGEGVFADLLSTRFRAACARHGLVRSERESERTDLFNPAAIAYLTDEGGSAQGRLFD
jgi:DNA repair photolyase